MQRLLLALSLALVFATAACAGDTDEPTDDNTTAQDDKAPAKTDDDTVKAKATDSPLYESKIQATDSPLY